MQRILFSIVLITLALPLCAKEKVTGSNIPQIERVVVTTASAADEAAPNRAQRQQLSELPALPVETQSLDEAADTTDQSTQAAD